MKLIDPQRNLRHPAVSFWGIALVLAGLAALPLSACGNKASPTNEDELNAEDNKDTIDLGDGDGSFGDGDDSGDCQGLSIKSGCAGEVYEGESVPLDLYLMFDQSGSMLTDVDGMGTTRIDIVRDAVRTFLKDDESVGLGAGIGYFGHLPLGETSCDPSVYAEADVPVGSLPNQESALVASLNAAEPTGETPTGAAIRGACSYVAAYRKDQPGRNTSILLVTDGEPKAPLSKEVCAPTLDDAVEAAEECFQEQGIRIYVLGVGPSLTNLRVIAEAGGTEQAYLADRDNTDQVLSAFRAVRNAAQLPCEMPLNEAAQRGELVNITNSTVAYVNTACEYVAVRDVGTKSGCEGGNGWYFDDSDAPTRIHLCDVTCGNVKSEGRQLYYSIGCPLETVR